MPRSFYALIFLFLLWPFQLVPDSLHNIINSKYTVVIVENLEVTRPPIKASDAPRVFWKITITKIRSLQTWPDIMQK